MSSKGIKSAFAMAHPVRIEHDLLGEREVPADAYWGVHTLRARRELPDHRQRHRRLPDLVKALALRQAGRRAGQPRARRCSTTTRADAIVAACEEIVGGALHDQFVVDVIQGGAGTSTNMNANEVIANRALELLGREQGRLRARCTRSTTSTWPEHQRRLPDGAASSALRSRIAAPAATRWPSCATRSRPRRDEFADVLKMGRTQLQDAVPMTLGQEFSTYARDARRGRAAPARGGAR